MTHDNTFLTDAQREQLRAQLEARKEQLLQELNAAQRDNLSLLPSRGDAAHPDDRKEHSEDMFFNTVRDAEASRDHDELVAVRAALERIADGSYGECLDCGQGVGLARLQAQPQALRCVGCQSKAETRLK